MTVGSRAPTGEPVWITQGVLHGGFVAAGHYAAGGPLTDSERELQAKLGHDSDAERGVARRRLNAWSVSSAGQDFWLARLNEGKLRIPAAEQGALLCVGLLLEAGEQAAAQGVLREIVPYFDRLRFYPELNDEPLPRGSAISRETVRSVTCSVSNAMRPTKAHRKLVVALSEFLPWYDSLADLVRSTRDAEGTLFAAPITAEQKAQLAALVEAGGRIAGQEGANRCFRRGGARALLAALDAYQRGTAQLAQHRHRAGQVLQALDARAAAAEARGSSLAAMRASQAEQGQQVMACTLQPGLVATRLAKLPQDQGMDAATLDRMGAPVTAEEARTCSLREGTEIADSIKQKMLLALNAPLEELVKLGIIPSPEVLATVADALVSAVKSEKVQGDAAKALVYEIGRAFATRRSVLLLNMESQVKINELPWYAAVVRAFEAPPSARSQEAGELGAARQLVELWVRYFGGRQIPNELADALAQLKVPAVVKEIAADIFMNAFSYNYVRQLQAIAPVLTGTLYEKYYGLEAVFAAAPTMASEHTGERVGWGAPTDQAFYDLASIRAGAAKAAERTTPSWLVSNGMIIEQASVMTSHNLVHSLLYVGTKDVNLLIEGAKRAWKTILRCTPVAAMKLDWRARLSRAQDVAFALRQMLALLSMAQALGEDTQVEEFLAAAAARVTERHLPSVGRLIKQVQGAMGAGDVDFPMYGWSASRPNRLFVE